MSEIIERQYDRWAAVYDWAWCHYTLPSLTRLIRHLSLESSDALLDVGCGTGELERMLAPAHPALRITGVDLSKRMLEAARRKLRRAPNVCFEQAGATNLPFEDDAFDHVVSASAFHYFREPMKALREMRRVAASDGRIIVMDWARDHLPCRLLDLVLRYLDPAYHRCYTEEELRALMRAAQLEVQDVTRFRFGLFWEMLLVTATPAAEKRH